MKARLALAAGAVAFLIAATANSGGYRFGISDQAFYIPAIAHAADPALFPRDTAVLAPQMNAWAGDELLAAALRVLPFDLPGLFLLLYIAGVLLLFWGGVFFARALGASWFAVAGALALLTVRHRIAKTGANSLEGYMHPRMIAFALGLIALGFVLRRRLLAAGVLVVIAGVAHPTTALWFAGTLALGFAAENSRHPIRLRGFTLAWIAALTLVGYFIVTFLLGAPRMDGAWLSVLGEKDYLFSHEWPLYAWVVNLLYPVVLVLLYRRRRALGVSITGEWPLVAGLVGLVGIFLLSVPIAALHVAPIVQLQVNRVFWLLDAVTLLYLAWWLVDDVAGRRQWRAVAAGILIAAACFRGGFIMVDTGRAFVQRDLPRDDWTEAMGWIRTQPVDWLVLADPGHAWKYGTSVRVAALRDTVLEQSKDAAMAMYDRSVALRISDRINSLSGFETFSEEQFRALAQKYDARVLILERTPSLDLPRLYENSRFVIYNLR